MQRTADALQWFLDHGGSVDIKDNDGVTARGCMESVRQKVANAGRRGLRLPMWDVVDRKDRRRRQLAESICASCARNDARLLKCSQSMKAKYCSPPRSCQKLGWPIHKAPCTASRAQPTAQGTYLGMPLP